jgi:hypothetical protein
LRATPDECVRGYMKNLLVCGNVQPGFGPVQRVQRALHVNAGIAAREALFRALFGLAGAFCVNLRRTLRRLGENRHFLRQHFRKAPGHGQPLLG